MITARAKCIVTLVIAVLLAGAGAVLAVRSGAWTKWRAQRYVSRAEALARSGAVEAARSACLQALALNGDSVPALRALLRVLPPGDLGGALMLHVRLADLAPGDRENLRALAFTAIAAERYDLAYKAAADIARIPGGEREAQEWLARILMARGDHAGAAQAARELLAVEPGNVAARLILALSQVFTQTQAAEAETALAELAAHPKVRVEALRGLREAARQRGDEARARELAETIAAEPQATFTDALVRADLTTKVDASQFEPQLAELTRRAGANAATFGLIAKWMRQRGRADRVDAWVEETEPLRRDVPTAQMIRAETLADLKAWDRLTTLLAPANWRDLDFLRHAFLARAARERGDATEAEGEWRLAEDGAREGLRPRLLADTMKDWRGWEVERERVLWTAAKRPENSRWAFTELTRHYEARQDTRALRRVMDEWLLAEPDNVPAKNNFAYYSLLLGTSLERAHRLAEEGHAAFPNDAAIASTRALSLIVRGQHAEALALLEKLPEPAARRPGIAACRALALAGVGRKDEAEALAGSVDEKQLLPELREKLRGVALVPPGS